MHDSIRYDPLRPTVGYNYHFTDSWYVRVDPRMAGPSWYRGHRIAGVHSGDRRLILADRDSREVWNPVEIPGAEWCPGEVVTTHTCCYNGITTAWQVIAAGDHPSELWRVTIGAAQGANGGAGSIGGAARRISVTLAVVLPAASPMGCDTRWDAPAGRFVSRSTPFHGSWDDYEVIDRDSQETFITVSPAPQGVCTSQRLLDAFLRDPEPAITHQLMRNSVDPPAVAARWELEIPREIPPGREHVVYLEISREARGSALHEQCWAGAIGAAQRYFRDEGGSLTVDTPEARLNEMVNSALKKEIMWSTRLWRNGISTPWRNELQDALGYALWNPEAAYPFLEAVTAVQKPSGYLQVWNTRSGENPNHPLVGSRHTDGGIWLILCWVLYLRVTGRWECWMRELPFADGSTASLKEHLLRAAQFGLADRGAHGLVLFHDGDWTDPMNGPGREGRGESGWATEALIVALAELGSVVRLLEGATPAGTACASELDQSVRELHDALVATLWDGRQFAAGTDDDGRRFGDSADGRTFLNPQSWGIMAEYAAGGDVRAGEADRPGVDQQRIFRCVTAIASLATPWGPRLLDPPFCGWDPQVGRVSLKVPGTTENGSVYCHGSAFAAWALALAGDTAASLDIIMRTLPGHPDHLRAAPDVPQQLPVYQPNSYFYHPGHPQCGTSTGTLGTGTCTWIVLTVFLQYFGLSFEPQGLRVAPRLPPAWPQASISFVRRGTTCTVHVVRDGADPAQLDAVNQSACIHIAPGQCVPWPDGPGQQLTIAVTLPQEAS